MCCCLLILYTLLSTDTIYVTVYWYYICYCLLMIYVLLSTDTIYVTVYWYYIFYSTYAVIVELKETADIKQSISKTLSVSYCYQRNFIFGVHSIIGSPQLMTLLLLSIHHPPVDWHRNPCFLGKKLLLVAN
jgi:hypothetical protein